MSSTQHKQELQKLRKKEAKLKEEQAKWHTLRKEIEGIQEEMESRQMTKADTRVKLVKKSRDGEVPYEAPPKHLPAAISEEEQKLKTMEKTHTSHQGHPDRFQANGLHAQQEQVRGQPTGIGMSRDLFQYIKGSQVQWIFSR